MRILSLVFVAVMGSPALAGLTLTSGLGTTHTGNLVGNGSFETGAPPDGLANAIYWASGTANTPFGVPPLWTSSGGPSTYAYWGNDAPGSINGSDTIPDGRVALYFGNGAPAFVNQPPTFQANGAVTFPAAPSFFTPYGPQVTLSQIINTLANPAAAYNFSFWVSGEGAVSGQNFTERGIFGLQLTNVLPGDPVQWLAVPNGSVNTFGTSHLYEYQFTPLNPILPVTITFINLGHFDLAAYGMSNFTTELVLDDVIINVVPEPGTVALLAGGVLFLAGRRFGGRR